MAKLHSYYVLCPLIDQKSFLGVAKDRNRENVIVTLGRNVVNTYRLSDQKQISGWTSKDHITSFVIYCKDYESYVGVFNNNIIKMWKNDTENLEQVKKYKFPVPILRILTRGERTPLIVLSNGNCVSIVHGIENRKKLDVTAVLKEADTITDIDWYYTKLKEYICYIVKNNNVYEIVICPLKSEICQIERDLIKRVRIKSKERAHVVGKYICNKGVFVLWSDSKLTSYDFQNSSWKTLGHVPWISTTSNASLSWMGERHLIMFGSDTQGDGAILVAYNVSLGVGSYKYPMKMYFNDAKLYCYNNKIILEAGTHVGMVPYELQANRDLSSLLGSHEVNKDNTIYTDWGYGKVSLPNDTSIKPLLELGISERVICAQLLPSILEKSPAEISTFISEFCDIPESVIVLLLQYAIKALNIIEPCSDKDFVQAFTSPENEDAINLLSVILSAPFSDAIMIPHLRNGLTLNNAVLLMNFLSYSLLTCTNFQNSDGERRLFDWCTVLLDSFYQQFLMTNSEAVASALQNMADMVDELIKQLHVIDSALPYINRLLSKKIVEDSHKEAALYTIEVINI